MAMFHDCTAAPVCQRGLLRTAGRPCAVLTSAEVVALAALPPRDARGRFVELAPELPPGPLLSAEVLHDAASLPKSGDTPDAIRADLDALLADHGRALHLRRQLHKALDHGFALLDAFDLSPLALDVVDDSIAALDALDGDADFEPTLGAPERCPWSPDMGASFYKPARGGRLIRCFDTRAWNQAAWAAGSRLDGEGEPEAGYDLPEGDDELCGSEHDGCELEEGEPDLGSSIGDGDQENWAQGHDSETVNEDGDGETGPDANAPHPYSRPISPRRPDTMGYQTRDDSRAIARRARDVRARLHPSKAIDPDTVTIIRAGMAVWSGPYVTRDGIPVIGCAS